MKNVNSPPPSDKRSRGGIIWPTDPDWQPELNTGWTSGMHLVEGADYVVLAFGEPNDGLSYRIPRVPVGYLSTDVVSMLGLEIGDQVEVVPDETGYRVTAIHGMSVEEWQQNIYDKSPWHERGSQLRRALEINPVNPIAALMKVLYPPIEGTGIVITGPGGVSKSKVAYSLVAGLIDTTDVFYLMVERPSEAPVLEGTTDHHRFAPVLPNSVNLFTAPWDIGEENQLFAISMAMHIIARRAMFAEKPIAVFLDSVTVLASVLNATSGEEARMSGGLAQSTLKKIRELFWSLARHPKGKSSVTLFGIHVLNDKDAMSRSLAEEFHHVVDLTLRLSRNGLCPEFLVDAPTSTHRKMELVEGEEVSELWYWPLKGAAEQGLFEPSAWRKLAHGVMQNGDLSLPTLWGQAGRLMHGKRVNMRRDRPISDYFDGYPEDEVTREAETPQSQRPKQSVEFDADGLEQQLMTGGNPLLTPPKANGAKKPPQKAKTVVPPPQFNGVVKPKPVEQTKQEPASEKPGATVATGEKDHSDAWSAALKRTLSDQAKQQENQK